MNTRVVGKRVEQKITFDACGELLKKGCLSNDAMHQAMGITGSGIPKGVYHFKNHEEANEHQAYCLSLKMAKLAMERSNG